MNLQSSANCSDGDFIEVLKMNATNIYETVTRLCGIENYAPLTITNTTQVLLKFSSGYNSDGGFKIRYEQIPSIGYHFGR